MRYLTKISTPVKMDTMIKMLVIFVNDIKIAIKQKLKTKDKLVELKDKGYHEKRSEKRHRMLQAAKVREHKRQKDENKTNRRRH